MVISSTVYVVNVWAVRVRLHDLCNKNKKTHPEAPRSSQKLPEAAPAGEEELELELWNNTKKDLTTLIFVVIILINSYFLVVFNYYI